MMAVSVPSYLKFKYEFVLMLSSPKPCSISFSFTCFTKRASLLDASAVLQMTRYYKQQSMVLASLQWHQQDPSHMHSMVLFAGLVQRTSRLVLLWRFSQVSAATVFFSHNKPARTVFFSQVSDQRTGPIFHNIGEQVPQTYPRTLP